MTDEQDPHQPAPVELDLDAAIAAQQAGDPAYPLEAFCPRCGKGHLAMPFVLDSLRVCQRCGAPVTIFRVHPSRARRREGTSS